jgi:hypothetical protein
VNRAAGVAAALALACCILGPAAIAAGLGAAAGSWLGVSAALVLAVACVGALLLWHRRGRRAC